jgi:alkanesulfonate monooxygenase SsuD/methylene tetrahydromethanopterin reductase-like flavin-dependent oxidoreductase (luciferase family)
MRFSVYSELQLHPGKTAEQLYGEVLEQIVNADRLGYAAYAAIEHFVYPKFSVSSNPTALFAAAAQRTRTIRFRTMLHVLPYHNPLVLASAINATDILTGGRYEWGVGRGHGWLPLPAGQPLDEHARPRYEEAVDLLLQALAEDRFSFDGAYFQVEDSHVVPFTGRDYRVYLGGTSDRTYTLAAEHGWGVAVPPLLPYAALEQQMDLYRASCVEHGTEPDIVWIHACHLDEDRETARREARGWIKGFIDGNASPLTEWPKPPADALGRPATASTRPGSWRA